jgi:hypothetical protein
MSRNRTVRDNQLPVQFFRAADMFQRTKLQKIFPNDIARKKFAGPGGFMDVKRSDPNAQFGSSDKSFERDGKFGMAAPGIRHAHITFDLSIVYRVEGRNIYLYGFFTHDELGTGTPPNRAKQTSMASQFKNATFVEDSSWPTAR